VPIPDSGVCAAIGYSEQSGIPMRMGLIRNHYVGRTFIQPQQSIRHFGVRVKLNPVRSIIDGKRAVLVDDSIVRGTTSRQIVRLDRGGREPPHLRPRRVLSLELVGVQLDQAGEQPVAFEVDIAGAARAGSFADLDDDAVAHDHHALDGRVGEHDASVAEDRLLHMALTG